MSAIHRRYAGLLTASALLMSPAASAATEEIIVTAQKREQSVQDIPIAISVVSEDDIVSRDVTDIRALNNFSPNLRITQTPGNSTSSQISIRGGVTINPALTWETTVGLYLDGVYIGKTQGSVFDVVDIERVEVLRGPQGTLYGRNTLAGGINIVTRAPSGELNGYAKAGIGNYGLRTLAASVDLPAMGPVRLQLAGRTTSRDGWIDVDNAPGFPASSVSELNDVDRTAFRLALDADMGERASLAYRLDVSEADQAASHSQLSRLDFDFGLPLGGFIFTDRQEDAAVDGALFEESEVIGHSLTFDVDLTDALQFRSVTAYRDMEWNDGLDLDGSPIDVAQTQRLSDYDSLSQEFQLIGTSGNVSYVAGLYYFEDDGFTDNPQSFFGAFGPFGLPFISRYGFTTEAWALFGQLDWAVNERFTLTAGLRYTDEEKTIERELGSPGLPRTIPAGTDGSTSFDDVTPTIGATWFASENVTVYAKVSEGFKSGGFNGEAQTVAETLQPYDSETVRSFEAGVKGVWADGRLRANVAVFNNDHKDMQLSVFTAQGAAASNIRNAGEAQIRGVEVDAVWQINDDWSLRGSYGYLDSDYDEFLDCGGAVDVASNRALPHAPENTFNLSLDGVIARGGWGEVRVIADHNRVDDHYLYPFPIRPDTNPACAASALAPNTEIDGYDTTDLRFMLSGVRLGNDAQLEVSLWAKNVTDEEYIANAIDFGPGFANLTTAYYGLPRTYGLDLRVDF